MSAEAHRSSLPEGVVSIVRGHWQGPALTWTTRALLALALLGTVLPGSPGTLLAVAAAALVIAVPLLRVVWLVVRWTQERDVRFVVVGLALLSTVALGATFAALGVGG